MGIQPSFASIWISEKYLDEFVQNSSEQSIKLLKAQPGKAAEGVKFSASIPKESYKRGKVLEIECTFENTSGRTYYDPYCGYGISFVAMYNEEIIVHLGNDLECAKNPAPGYQEFRPKQKLKRTLRINTERFWQERYKNEKNSFPSFFDGKRVAVAIFLCYEGFRKKKHSQEFLIKSNIIQFEVVE